MFILFYYLIFVYRLSLIIYCDDSQTSKHIKNLELQWNIYLIAGSSLKLSKSSGMLLFDAVSANYSIFTSFIYLLVVVVVVLALLLLLLLFILFLFFIFFNVVRTLSCGTWQPSFLFITQQW